MSKKMLSGKSFERVQTTLRLAVFTFIFSFANCSRVGTESSKRAENDPNLGTVGLNRPANTEPKIALAMTDMPFEQLVNATSGLLDDFWRQSFKDMLWQETYRAPNGLIPYTEPTPSDCGMLLMSSAFYCPADRNIYFDDNFMRGLYKDSGEVAVITVLAHEWGHSAHRDISVTGGNNKLFVSIDRELQADCFAGAFFKYIYESGYLEEPEIETESVFSVGARQNLKWFDPLTHGTTIQREAYFNEGWEAGVKSCIVH